jgi:hypothetical protein
MNRAAPATTTIESFGHSRRLWLAGLLAARFSMGLAPY